MKIIGLAEFAHPVLVHVVHILYVVPAVPYRLITAKPCDQLLPDDARFTDKIIETAGVKEHKAIAW